MADKYIVNPFTGKLDNVGQFKGALASAPTRARNGDSYINTGDHTLYMYYSGAWRVIVTWVIATEFLLLENGDFFLLEDGSSKIVLEA